MRVLTANEYEALEIAAGGKPVDVIDGTTLDTATKSCVELGYIREEHGVEHPDGSIWTYFHITATGEKALRIHREYLKGK